MDGQGELETKYESVVDDSHKYTNVLTDEYVGPGGAQHHYLIVNKDLKNAFLEVIFQDGPIKESGVNGVMDENLLAIVIDRLKGFQSGKYASDFNQRAMELIEAGLKQLKERTAERESRGVEGTHAV